MASAESEQIKNLYQFSEILDNAGADAVKHEDVYKGILEGTKGGPKTRSLSATLIPRYFKYFPDLVDEGINALTDLCEEEDLQIRVQAVRAFAIICKDIPSTLPKAADVLGQLLQAEIQVEQDNVKHSLLALLRIDTKGVIAVLFNQIMNRDEAQREKAIHFLKDKVFSLKDELLSPFEDVEKDLAAHIKKALTDVTGDEFKIFMKLLSGLKIYQGANSKELLQILADQADLTSDFKVTDSENLERLLSCMQMALPYLQKASTAGGHGFLDYLASKVLPSFEELGEDHQTRLLQSLAEMSPFASAEEARLLLPSIYSLFKTQVPPKAEGNDAPKLNWSLLESVLFIFHQLGFKAPGAVSALTGVAAVYTGQPSDMVTIENAAEKLKEFKDRLQLLAHYSELFVKELNERLKPLASDKEKFNTATKAIQTTKNVQEMVKVLMKPKPVFYGRSSGLRLSWQKPDTKRKTTEPKTQINKPNPVKENNGAKKQRGGFQGVYTPPGKRGDAPIRGTSRGGRGGNRGGFRGRGRGRF